MAKATIIVKGWVQSVGYRAFVKRVASQLGLKGLVRNLPDGRVEIFCKGRKPRIETFVRMIDYKGRKDDPLSCYVEHITVYRKGEKGYAGPWKKHHKFVIDYGFKIHSRVERALLESMENRTFYVASYRDRILAFENEES
jgi:acylphosphatase